MKATRQDPKLKNSVIVADPAAFQRRILRLILEKDGIEVAAEAGSLAELLAQTEALPTRLILCDASLIAEAESTTISGLAEGRTVLVTGTEADEADFVRVIESGAQSFLLKPYTAQGVRRALFDADFEGSVDLFLFRDETEEQDAP